MIFINTAKQRRRNTLRVLLLKRVGRSDVGCERRRASAAVILPLSLPACSRVKERADSAGSGWLAVGWQLAVGRPYSSRAADHELQEAQRGPHHRPQAAADRWLPRSCECGAARRGLTPQLIITNGPHCAHCPKSTFISNLFLIK